MLQFPYIHLLVFFWGDAAKGHFKESLHLRLYYMSPSEPPHWAACLLIDVRENAAFPQLLLAWDYRPSVFGPIYWVDWSPVVGPISIREPNRLLRNLAGGEVPWSSDWTMHEASGHCMVLSTTAPFLSLLGEDKSRYQTPGQAPPAQSICA